MNAAVALLTVSAAVGGIALIDAVAEQKKHGSWQPEERPVTMAEDVATFVVTMAGLALVLHEAPNVFAELEAVLP